MLATLTDVLTDARANAYAVPAFDCVEDVMVRAILETAEAKRAPVILMGLRGAGLEGTGWAYLSGLIRAVADHHAIPIVLHLDHATDPAEVATAIECGFTSVMIDGSTLPLEANVALTREVVEMARRHGVSVEAELGYVGGMDLADVACAESVLTEPAEVARFVEATGVDALAVSIGTAHGVYRAQPRLNIERLRQIEAVSPVPLVLHGGSGTPDTQIRQAVAAGITKVNLFADQREAMGRGLRQAVDAIERPDPMPQEIFGPIKAELSGVIAAKIDLLSAADRAGPE